VSIRSLIKTAEKLAVDNSPTIISALAVTGTLTTAYLTAKATFRASEILQIERMNRDMQELRKDEEITKTDAAKLVWKEYIPPALAVVGTVACIVTANSISASRLAGLAAAYKLTEQQYKEYEDKIKEKLGLQEEKRVRDEIAEAKVRNNPPSNDVQLYAGEDEVVFLEDYTGRYFRSKMHLIKAAQNRINASLITNQHATLTDFYDEIGLKRTSESSEIGWSLENAMELDFTTALADQDTRPVIVLRYANRPHLIRDYIRYREGEPYSGFGMRGSEDAQSVR
jgi:hypothetical protein